MSEKPIYMSCVFVQGHHDTRLMTESIKNIPIRIAVIRSIHFSSPLRVWNDPIEPPQAFPKPDSLPWNSVNAMIAMLRIDVISRSTVSISCIIQDI